MAVVGADDNIATRLTPVGGGVIGVLVAHNVVLHQFAPAWTHVGLNLATVGGLVAMARHTGLGWSELGLTFGRRDRIWTGVVAAAAAAAALGLIAVVPATRELLADGRFAGVSSLGAARKVLVEIPLTVGFEEVAYRGILLGVLQTVISGRMASAGAGLLFGLSHALGAVPDEGTGTPVTESAVLIISATVAVTTAAGLVFNWLRTRDQTVLSSALLHVVLNGTSYTVGWLASTSG